MKMKSNVHVKSPEQRDLVFVFLRQTQQIRRFERGPSAPLSRILEVLPYQETLTFQ